MLIVDPFSCDCAPAISGLCRIFHPMDSTAREQQGAGACCSGEDQLGHPRSSLSGCVGGGPTSASLSVSLPLSPQNSFFSSYDIFSTRAKTIYNHSLFLLYVASLKSSLGLGAALSEAEKITSSISYGRLGLEFAQWRTSDLLLMLNDCASP